MVRVSRQLPRAVLFLRPLFLNFPNIPLVSVTTITLIIALQRTVPYRSVYTVYIVYTELLRQRSAADENFQLSNASGQCDKSFGYLATKDAKKYRVYLLYIKL